MIRKKVLMFICCIILVFTGCQGENKDSDVTAIPAVNMTGENPLDLRKIYIKRPGSIRTPSTDFLPRTYDMEMEIIEEVNKILEEKINTIIDIEYIPVPGFKKE